MLPVEKATRELWFNSRYLCDTQYEISTPFSAGTNDHVQRIRLEVPDEHRTQLLDAYNLSLKRQDGQFRHIPQVLPRP